MKQHPFRSAGLVACASTLFIASAADAATRFTFTIDTRTLSVDNASTMSNDWVRDLVIAADRSMREDCPYDPPDVVGHMLGADRIFVNDNYIAWFDYSIGDAHNQYSSDWARGGELAGYWTLNPETHYFRYFRSNLCGSHNWVRNELVVGAARPESDASLPEGLRRDWWWSDYAPPVEHVVVVGDDPDDLSYTFFGAVHYGPRSPSSLWQRTADGTSHADGVHYAVSTRLVSPESQIDVTDNDDHNPPGNPIGNYINAEQEYVCRPRDILSVFKFTPAVAPVTAENTFMYVWTAHSLDEDGHPPCDQVVSSNDYPTPVPQELPLFATSSLPISTEWSGTHPAGQIVTMDLGPTCPIPRHNQDMRAADPGDGDFITWGEAPNLSTAAAPAFTLAMIGAPNSGAGSHDSPRRIPMTSLTYANETFDGVLGGGEFRQELATYQPGTWYGDTFSLSSHPDAGNGRGDWNHDGKADILWRNNVTQELRIWYMDGVNRISTGSPDPDHAVHSNWRAVGTADFNNDGKQDILFYNVTSTKIVVWFMDNDAVRINGNFTSPSLVAGGPGWQAMGEADFNSDGRPDIVWRNLNSGAVVVWFMRLVPDDPATGVVTQQGGGYTTPSTAALSLELVAADDFNSDGKADILFQDTGTGALTLWVMNGLTQVSTVPLGTEGAGWKVAGSGNFNEDQAIDIVWRHTDGRVRVWLMNPDTLTTHVTRNLNPNQEPDTSWVIVGPH